MAITGKLEADFSEFNLAVQTTEAKLKSFEGSSDKVTAALTRLTDTTPPRIARISAGLTDMSGAAGGALGPLNSLREVTGSFDATLNALGIHVGPAIRGLTELGAASGQTVGELGLLGAGGLAVGAAFAGWKIGSAINDMYGLDVSIGNGLASLFGFGDAAQIAGAKADSMALATQRAGRAVTDYSEALKINQAFVVALQAKAAELDLVMSRMKGAEASAYQIAKWDAAIQDVRDSGALPALIADLNSHNFSLKELSDRYTISVEALQHYTKGQQDAAAATAAGSKAFAAANAQQQAFAKIQKEIDESHAKRAKEASDADKKWAAGMAELTIAGKGMQGVLDSVNGSVVEAIKFYLDAGVSQDTLAKMYGLTAIQVRAVAEAYREETAAKKASNAETLKATAVTTTQTATLAKQVEMVHTLSGEYITLAAAQKLRDTGGSATIPDLTPKQVEMMGGRQAIEEKVALGRPSQPSTNTREGYADLAKRQAAYEAMVRYLAGLTDVTAAPLQNLASSVVGGFGEQGGGVTVNIQVSGVLDPRTIQELSRGVSDELMKTAKRGRRFGA